MANGFINSAVNRVAHRPHGPKNRKETKEVQAHEADTLDSVEQSNKDRNESLVGDGPSGGTSVSEPHRKKGESTQQYNERVPVAVQPVQPNPDTSYLGKPL